MPSKTRAKSKRPKAGTHTKAKTKTDTLKARFKRRLKRTRRLVRNGAIAGGLLGTGALLHYGASRYLNY